MDTDWNCKKKWENKRVYALRGGWTITGIAKKKYKIKRVYALGGGWTMIEIAKKSAKQEGLCIKGWVDNNWNSKKSAKIRGVMYEGAHEQ